MESSASPGPSMPSGNGWLDGFMTRLLGRSWRTGFAGTIALACGLAPLIPGIPPPVLEVCKVLLPLATGSGMMLAKDSRVSGKP